MNIVLWILQVLLALAFVAVGINHGFRVDSIKSQQGMGWVSAVPRPLMTFIGVCEILGGIGLILPALTNIQPWLTPLAAALLAVMMILAFLFHIPRHEYPNLVTNAILFGLSAFIAYGRYVWAPF